jgi:ELWxxDGT repeat protein
MKNALLTPLMVASSFCSFAQPTMLGDINPGASSSYPCWMTGYNNGKVLFFANNGTNGYELYVHDSNSRLQYDINPGSSDGGTINQYAKMAIINNVVYMVGNNGASGNELFMWNGNDTVAPTLVSDIYPGSTGSSISELAVMDSKLYFNAFTSAYGNELWSYNPATAYLQRLTDLYAGATSSNPHNMVAMNGKLYFSANSATTGSELYMYDPISNTTTLAMDINTGTPSSDPMGTILMNGKLYFSATTPAYGRELYSFDGINLSRLTNVDNTTGDGVTVGAWTQKQLCWYKNKLYFSGTNGASSSQLYCYNPVNGVTSLVYAINPGGPSAPKELTVYGGKLFFSADDGTNGAELWAFNGTNVPMMVANIDTIAFTGSQPSSFLRYGTRLYFAAATTTSGDELYSILDSVALTVQNIRFDGNVKVYPNPTTGNATIQVTLKSAQQLTYTLTDITGKVIDRAELAMTVGEQAIAVNLNNTSTGIYLYRLTDDKGVMMASGRIEKQ